MTSTKLIAGFISVIFVGIVLFGCTEALKQFGREGDSPKVHATPTPQPNPPCATL